jgi:HD-GYP domain-containing protein (c-di-GMP phosphodiesterase class II)
VLETGADGVREAEFRGEIDDLVNLREAAETSSVSRAVEAVREFLGMEVAYASEFVDGQQVFRNVRGDKESFGVDNGTRFDLGQTYCERVLSGRLPNLIPDVRADDRAASLAVTEAADVGAFVSVPLRFSDGRLFGTLCAASHEAQPSLGYRELQFLKVFARLISDQLERGALEHRTRELEMQAAAAEALVAAVQARDSYTGEHSRDVVAHAGAVARMLGLGEAEVVDVERVALLHDIGKIAVPDAILGKPAALNEDEWKVMREHPALGERLIRATPGLAHLAPAIRAEHERWDGGGYPDGLRAEQIPLASRITLVCDAYHAMISDRPYRAALPAAAARAEIEANAGTQFCPVAARALLAVLDGGEVPARREPGTEPEVEDETELTRTALYQRVSEARTELLELIGSIDSASRQSEAAAIHNELEDDLLLAANRLGRVAGNLLPAPGDR